MKSPRIPLGRFRLRFPSCRGYGRRGGPVLVGGRSVAVPITTREEYGRVDGIESSSLLGSAEAWCFRSVCGRVCGGCGL